MKRLYFDFALQNKGVSEEDYRSVLENVSGSDFSELFNDYINGTRPYESIITEALDFLGLELKHGPSELYSESKLGIKSLKSSSGGFIVKAMYPGGPAETGGMMLNDEIIAVNGYACNGELEKWLSYFDEDIKRLTLKRKGKIIELQLPEVHRNFYMTYSVEPIEDPNSHQKRAFDLWSK
jgi:predicted metalloprotease with PDZ domain